MLIARAVSGSERGITLAADSLEGGKGGDVKVLVVKSFISSAGMIAKADAWKAIVLERKSKSLPRCIAKLKLSVRINKPAENINNI